MKLKTSPNYRTQMVCLNLNIVCQFSNKNIFLHLEDHMFKIHHPTKIELNLKLHLIKQKQKQKKLRYGMISSHIQLFKIYHQQNNFMLNKYLLNVTIILKEGS